MTDINETPKCGYCGCYMVEAGFDEDGIRYVCPNDCEFEAASELHGEQVIGMIPEPKPYENHCWNCHSEISSEKCEPDPGYGYKCNECGKSLREWKAMREEKLSG